MSVVEQARRARDAAEALAVAPRTVKDAALHAMADALVARTPEILAANATDLAAGRAAGLTAAVLDRLGEVDDVAVFGGGGRSALYRRALAARTGLPIVQGPVEATALGNALVQGIALGRYADLADARAHLAPAVATARSR